LLRTKPPPSKWLSRRARAQEQPLAPTTGGCATSARRDRDRLLAGVLDVDLEVVLQVLADAGQVGDDVDAERRSSAALPTPESCSSCGELIAPPQRITSPARTRSAAAAARYSTPTARVPSNRTR
jgi:hypothetical protein